MSLGLPPKSFSLKTKQDQIILMPACLRSFSDPAYWGRCLTCTYHHFIVLYLTSDFDSSPKGSAFRLKFVSMVDGGEPFSTSWPGFQSSPFLAVSGFALCHECLLFPLTAIATSYQVVSKNCMSKIEELDEYWNKQVNGIYITILK